MDKESKNVLIGKQRSTLKMLCLMILSLFFAFGCEKYENLEYPIDIPIIDYSLEKSGCFWAYVEEDSLYVINSQEELLALLYCNKNCTPPPIDFSKYSLLIVWGHTDSTYDYVIDISKKLQRLSWIDYQLNLGVLLDENANDADAMSFPRIDKRSWLIAVLVPKLSRTANITFHVDINRLNENELPEGIVFTKKFMPDIHWDLYNIEDDTLYIVNSQMELLNIIGFSENVDLDFTQHSLLFVRGLAPNMIGHITKKLQQLSEHNYKLNIGVGLMPPDVQEKWTVALVVQKMNIEDKIELNITYY